MVEVTKDIIDKKEERHERYIRTKHLSEESVEVIFRDEQGSIKSVFGEEFKDCGALIRVTCVDRYDSGDLFMGHRTYINKKNVLIVRCDTEG